MKLPNFPLEPNRTLEPPQANRLDAQSRYDRDPVFRYLVDSMISAINTSQLTPTELREAAIFACIRYERMNCNYLYVLDDRTEETPSRTAAHCVRCGFYWTVPQFATTPEKCPRCGEGSASHPGGASPHTPKLPQAQEPSQSDA